MSNVIVIGGGIAGIQAALDIAGHGIHVHLVERDPSIGGHMAQLDKTFPTNDCSMCILSPKMVDVARHPHITVHTCAEVETIHGAIGNFMVTVREYPRYINPMLCTGCGDCIEICPVEVYNRFDAGVGVRKAVYRPHAQAVPNIVVKDVKHCIECGLCYDACGPGAILRIDEERLVTIGAASIVITTGYNVFDTRKKEQFGHLILPDVITSIEFERMINASGPTRGAIKRLSNGEMPKSIVFIQCVGSRDVSIGRPHCSCICCMQAIKNAMMIKEKNPAIEITICYMDIRAYGKGYEEYFNRAKTLGIRFLRGIPAEIIADRNGLIFHVENSENSEVIKFNPDLVVLSIGIGPSDNATGIAARCSIPLETSGFFKPIHDTIDSVATLRPGIYAAGTATAPRDIPDSVASGESAAMRAYLDAVRTRST